MHTWPLPCGTSFFDANQRAYWKNIPLIEAYHRIWYHNGKEARVTKEG
jgi:hypothetical protein